MKLDCFILFIVDTVYNVESLWFQIVTKRNRTLTLNLHNRDGRGLKSLGTLTVQAEETVASRNAVEMTFRCHHLDNKDLFSKSVWIL